MSEDPRDRVRVTATVKVEVAEAFRIFTEEIDAWWRRGFKYRVAGARRGIIHLEPRVGGRLFESFDTDAGTKVVQTGTVTAWEPPRRLSFEWRARAFGPDETTYVDVEFEAVRSGTQVTVVHRGWAAIPPDHSVRHGLDVGPFLRFMGMWWGDLLGSLREHARGPD